MALFQFLGCQTDRARKRSWLRLEIEWMAQVDNHEIFSNIQFLLQFLRRDASNTQQPEKTSPAKILESWLRIGEGSGHHLVQERHVPIGSDRELLMCTKTLSAILLCAALSLTGAWPAAAQQAVEPDTNDIYQSRSLAALQAANPDTTDVYRSKSKGFLAFPRYFWSALVYPLGKFTIYAEHVRLATRALFRNADRTFGVLPQVQFGGETGTGGGARIFHSNIAGKGKQFEGLYTYSGGRGQMGQALYMDPNLAGGRLYWRTEAAYLRTRNQNANINAAVRDDPSRRFRIDQVDVETALGWWLHTGSRAPYQRNLCIEGVLGYGRRDFRQLSGPRGPLTDPGSTPQARLLIGLGEDISLYRLRGRIAYDDRDYQSPTQEISHPLNYKLPGRIVTYAEGLYHYYRDLSYPERGGFLGVEAEVVTGSDDVRFFRVAARVQRFITFFWRNRILMLEAQLEKMHRIGGGIISYTDLAQLGGSNRFRGYRPRFLPRPGGAAFEPRIPISDLGHVERLYLPGGRTGLRLLQPDRF